VNLAQQYFNGVQSRLSHSSVISSPNGHTLWMKNH